MGRLVREAETGKPRHMQPTSKCTLQRRASPITRVAARFSGRICEIRLIRLNLWSS